jgi:hypothetical protein
MGEMTQAIKDLKNAGTLDPATEAATNNDFGNKNNQLNQQKSNGTQAIEEKWKVESGREQTLDNINETHPMFAGLDAVASQTANHTNLTNGTCKISIDIGGKERIFTMNNNKLDGTVGIVMNIAYAWIILMLLYRELKDFIDKYIGKFNEGMIDGMIKETIKS